MSSLAEGSLNRWQRSASATLNNLWSRPVGQVILKNVDRLLWTLEKSHQWSVPPNPDKPTTSELTRPLPWIMFLPLLVMLRISRDTASFAALFLGKEPVRPADIVKFIQQRRRAVRAVKYQGTRAMRARAHHTRQAPRKSWLNLMMRPAEAFFRIATGGLLFSPGLHKVNQEHGDRPSNSHKRQDTDEGLLEKLLQNADLSDNTSTDDSSYTLKNASDTDGGTTSSENPSFNTMEEIKGLQDEQSGNSCTSSPVKDSENNTTFIVSENNEDDQQNQLPNKTNLNEENSIDNSSTSDDATPDAKEASMDMLNSERAAYDRSNTTTKTTSSSAITAKDSQKTKSSNNDSPSKIQQKTSVPVVKVTLADEEPALKSEINADGGPSREGSYYNVPNDTTKVETRRTPPKNREVSPRSHSLQQIKETKKSSTAQAKQKSPSAVTQSTEAKSKIKRPFWRRKKSSPAK